MMKGCNDCHGPGGVSQSSDVPSLAGFPEFVHSDALYLYRDEERPCAESKYRHGDTSRPATSMCAIAAELSDDDIDALAAAYAELPYVKMKQKFDATLAAAGKALHDEHCDKCHSDAGTNAGRRSRHDGWTTDGLPAQLVQGSSPPMLARSRRR